MEFYQNNLCLKEPEKGFFKERVISKMKRLIIAEKPSVAGDIAAVLGAGMRKDGYIEGAQDIIT